MADATLSHAEIKQIFDYEASTGKLIWKSCAGKERSNKQRLLGKEAGSIARNGYKRILIGRKQYLAHRIVWNWCKGKWPENEIDHINRNRLDNRIENLRDVSRTVNGRNLSLNSRNKSGLSGVRWTPQRNRWYVTANGSYLGSFPCLLDAAAARIKVDNGARP